VEGLEAGDGLRLEYEGQRYNICAYDDPAMINYREEVGSAIQKDRDRDRHL
jgi:hypothetical protein